jgi:hypothetical protein
MPTAPATRRRRAPRADAHRLASVDVTADFLDVHPRTIRRMIHAGEPPDTTAPSMPYADCGRDTIGVEYVEYYMVHDHVWAAAGMADDADSEFLCTGCLERRLGRHCPAATSRRTCPSTGPTCGGRTTRRGCAR